MTQTQQAIKPYRERTLSDLSGSDAATAVSHDAIAHRAYEIYVKRGRKQGECAQNWAQAENELRTELQEMHLPSDE